MFQIFRCDAGFTFDGVSYTFTDVDRVAYTYSKTNTLFRGANATNKRGIIGQEGNKTADSAEYTIVKCSRAIYKLLARMFEDRARADFWFIDRETGEGYTYSQAVIQGMPRQLEISEDESSYSFTLTVLSFDTSAKINDDEANQ